MRKKEHFILFMAILIFVVKGVYYSVFLVPATLGEAPDEVGHFSYVHYLVDQKKLPVLYETRLYLNEQSMFLNYFFDNEDDFEDYVIDETFAGCKAINPNKDAVYNLVTGCENWIVQHPPLYYLLLIPTFFITSLFSTNLQVLIIALRLTNLIWGVLFVVFFYRILKMLKVDVVLTVVAMSFVVFSSMIQYTFSIITNDSLLITLSVMSIFYLLRFQNSRSNKDFLLFVIFTFSMIVTKYTAILVVIPYGLYFFFILFRNKEKKRIVRYFIEGAVVFLVVVVPVVVRNYVLYGELFPTYDPILEGVYSNMNYFDFINTSYLFAIVRFIFFEVGMKSTLVMNGLMFLLVGVQYLLSVLMVLFVNRATQLFGFYQKILLFVFLFAVHFTWGMLDIDSLGVNLSVLMLEVIVFYCFILLRENWKDVEKRNTLLFFMVTIFFMVFGFSLIHLNIYNYFGAFRGTHGRYYLILIVPFLLSFLEGNAILMRYGKMVRFLIPIMIVFSMLTEIYSIYLMNSRWY